MTTAAPVQRVPINDLSLQHATIQDELDAARPLGDGVSGEVFAKTACYAIGTTVENFFY